jgi:peptidoglycan/xylan/chitin deacetylase (PgdA/CDA1 family)
MTLAGADRRRRSGLVRDRSAAVLNLHRVSPEASPYWPPMRPDLFASLLQYLDKHFEVRSIRDLNAPQGNRPVAVLSFDDGYYDFLEYALPHLKRYGMRANMNVIPQCVESGRPIWNVRLYDFLAQATDEDVKKIVIRGFKGRSLGTSPRAKLRFGIELSKFLKSRPRSERITLFEGVEDLMAARDFRCTRMLNMNDVREISGDVDIGAHSYSHESMAFEDDAFFENDLAKCTEFFRSQLQQRLDIYAFPNGSYRPDQITLLQQRGVTKVLLVDEKLANLDANVVPRLTLYGDSSAEVLLRSVGMR